MTLLHIVSDYPIENGQYISPTKLNYAQGYTNMGQKITLLCTFIMSSTVVHNYYVLPSMCILSHMRMGWPIRVHPYRIPICVWDNLLSHISIFKNLIRMFLYRFYGNSG